MKQFRSFRLDVVNHCLWHGEARVPFTPKAFDVLRYLVEHADRLVTQDEILGALWPETYVNPEVIKKYVLEIRKALGDRRDKPEFIETFPRRGYQFVASVSEVSAGASSDVGIPAARKMVGREAAMAQLDSYLGQALKSQRQIVFITGEAGVGKTTLIDAFQQVATRRPNLRVVRGQCVEGFGGKEAYYPVLEALGQWVHDAGGGSVVHTLAKQAPTWLIQFPSLVKAEQREALQKEILGATRERMVREICEVLESLTAQDPLVLVLEDLHHAQDVLAHEDLAAGEADFQAVPIRERALEEVNRQLLAPLALDVEQVADVAELALQIAAHRRFVHEAGGQTAGMAVTLRQEVFDLLLVLALAEPREEAGEHRHRSRATGHGFTQPGGHLHRADIVLLTTKATKVTKAECPAARRAEPAAAEGRVRGE